MKKAPKRVQVFVIMIAILLAGALFGIGYYYHNLTLIETEHINLIIDDLEDQIPNQATTSLSLPTSLPNYPNISIRWASSHPSVIATDGQVIRPLYANGNKTVDLIATFTIKENDSLAQIAFSLLGHSQKEVVFEVVVLKREMTDQEKVAKAISDLYVPTSSATHVGLIDQFSAFPDMEIVWQSSDETILTNDGTKVGNGSVNLTATVSLNQVMQTIVFPMELKEKPEPMVALDFDLASITTGTYSTDWTSNQVLFHQAIIADVGGEKVIRMKANSFSRLDLLTKYARPDSITFDYQLYATDSDKLSKASYIGVRYSTNQVDWNILKNELIADGNLHQVSVDLTALQNVYLQITTSSEYLTDLRIDVSNISVTRSIDASDIQQWLSQNTIEKTQESITLLKTTAFGGVVTWMSDQPLILSDQGLVQPKQETQEVTLIASVSGFDFSVIYGYDIKIVGLQSVEPLELFFIDLGKYGQSDAGESIYFKLGSYDVLVDAGDRYLDSNKAIKEVIDDNSEDKILDLVIATHPDADHIGGMKFVFGEYEVLHLLQFYGTHTTQLYQDFVNSYEAENLVSECLVTDAINQVNGCTSEIEIADQVSINIIQTGYYETEEPNGRSIVFVLEAYGTKVLLTGDADNNDGRTTEANYKNEVGDIDILKAVHHATSYGTTLDFLASSKPEVVIITNGNYLGNKHGHPTADAINRMYQANDKTLVYAVVGGDATDCELTPSNSYECQVSDPFVDRNGTITIVIDQTGYEVSAEYSQVPIELSSTYFWETHPAKEYEYGG